MTYREFKIKFGLLPAPQVTEKQAPAPDTPPAKVEAPAPDTPPAKKRSHHKKR